MTEPAAPTAAVVLIGNELLSGKIRDENAAWLAGRLRALGVDLRRVVTIPDIESEIATEVRGCSERFTWVFTSGGVGPTHDDITLESVARAFDVELVLDAGLEAILRGHFRERLNGDHLRMAHVPRGATLVGGGPIAWPVISYRNVFVLPGVPEIFRAKFDTISERFQSVRFHLRNLYLNSDEGAIAQLLRIVEAAHGVQIGSYPRLDRAHHHVRVTVEARRPEPVNRAVEALVAGLPAAEVVEVDPPLPE